MPPPPFLRFNASICCLELVIEKGFSASEKYCLNKCHTLTFPPYSVILFPWGMLKDRLVCESDLHNLVCESDSVSGGRGFYVYFS